jgi:hypothetical protein
MALPRPEIEKSGLDRVFTAIEPAARRKRYCILISRLVIAIAESTLLLRPWYGDVGLHRSSGSN